MSSPDNTGTGPGMAVITGPAVNLETENALTVIPLASTTAAVAAAAVGASAERASGGDTGAEQQVAMVIAVEEQPWVSVGGSWKDEENVCGYWRFSEGAGGMGALGEDAQVSVYNRVQGLCASAYVRYVSACAFDHCFPLKSYESRPAMTYGMLLDTGER